MQILKIPLQKQVPVYAIHGNHERRTKDTLNPVQLLGHAGLLIPVHASSKTFEKNGEKIQVFGIGNVPEEFAATALVAAMKNFKPESNAFRILLIHQTIKDMLSNGEHELSFDHLERLPFDIIVNGHHHASASKLGGRFLIPGSTVITQLKKEETESKGYYMYDTTEKKTDFIPINSRKFFYEELEFTDATESEVRQRIRETITSKQDSNPGAIISIKLKGSLKHGLQCSDIKLDILDHYDNVFIDNRLNAESLAIRLEQIRELRTEKLSVRDLALKELIIKTKDRITLFDPAEIFERLVQGSEETMEYLRSGDYGKIAAGS
jgi:DNA repair exonuclease SbcCD nuclease subunit